MGGMNLILNRKNQKFGNSRIFHGTEIETGRHVPVAEVEKVQPRGSRPKIQRSLGIFPRDGEVSKPFSRLFQMKPPVRSEKRKTLFPPARSTKIDEPSRSEPKLRCAFRKIPESCKTPYFERHFLFFLPFSANCGKVEFVPKKRFVPIRSNWFRPFRSKRR